MNGTIKCSHCGLLPAVPLSEDGAICGRIVTLFPDETIICNDVLACRRAYTEGEIADALAEVCGVGGAAQEQGNRACWLCSNISSLQPVQALLASCPKHPPQGHPEEEAWV